MAKSRPAGLSQKKWLSIARKKYVQKCIVANPDLDTYQAIVKAAGKQNPLDWGGAIAILHMIYGWMPTMLKRIGECDPINKANLVAVLRKAQKGVHLAQDEIEQVASFANGSIVGASKLLHVICPAVYPIWDSRVAQIFLWRGVSPATFSTLTRYIEYKEALHTWPLDAEVAAECKKLRGLAPFLSQATNIRLMELVLFRSKR